MAEKQLASDSTEGAGVFPPLVENPPLIAKPYRVIFRDGDEPAYPVVLGLTHYAGMTVWDQAYLAAFPAAIATLVELAKHGRLKLTIGDNGDRDSLTEAAVMASEAANAFITERNKHRDL